MIERGFGSDDHRCDCGGVMEECDADFDQMTNGQLANYWAGFDRSFVCVECGKIDLKFVGVYDD